MQEKYSDVTRRFYSLRLFADFGQRTVSMDFLWTSGFTDYCMVRYVSFDRAALQVAPVPDHFGPKPFRPGTPWPKSFLLGLLGPDCILWQ